MMITIYMCNQIGTSEIREQFHARFVQILPISRAFFGQKESEIILLFYKYTIWLPLNPRTYTQSHTPTVVQGGWWGGGLISGTPPLSFWYVKVHQYFEKAFLSSKRLWSSQQDKLYFMGSVAASDLWRHQTW